MSEHTTPLTRDPDPTTDDERPRTLRVGYLVMGLIFLGIAGIWALNASGAVDWGDSKYAFPAVLVGAGLLGLAATVAINATRRTGHATTEPDRSDDATTILTDDEETER